MACKWVLGQNHPNCSSQNNDCENVKKMQQPALMKS